MACVTQSVHWRKLGRGAMCMDTCAGTGAAAGESRSLGCAVGVGFKTVCGIQALEEKTGIR